MQGIYLALLSINPILHGRGHFLLSISEKFEIYYN